MDDINPNWRFLIGFIAISLHGGINLGPLPEQNHDTLLPVCHPKEPKFSPDATENTPNGKKM